MPRIKKDDSEKNIKTSISLKTLAIFSKRAPDNELPSKKRTTAGSNPTSYPKTAFGIYGIFNKKSGSKNPERLDAVGFAPTASSSCQKSPVGTFSPFCVNFARSSLPSDKNRDRFCGLPNLLFARNGGDSIAILRAIAAKLSVAAAIQNDFRGICGEI